ncbi:hypothetical protein ALC53_08360 [Atta colombica]|uniref:Uncharacterized protein n=1 Tax=Atta colombica TaxID=520822 RepID=A0A195BAS4_9HYME|nr:hypothetical protein ALC53_08360 [Atta colombica]
MAIPFLPNNDENTSSEEQLMYQLYVTLHNALRSRNAHHPSRNHRAPRRSGSGSQQPLVIWLQPGNIEDLSNLPLPDLVQSAVDQLPPPSPHVTVSVPSSPMRDATFQFPECNVNSNGAPLPSPRPRPRRRFASESSVMETGPTEVSNCNGTTCRCHLGLILNERQSWTSVGANLRNIAGDFHACRTKLVLTTMAVETGERMSGVAPQLLFSIGFFLLNLRGETLEPGDWPFPRQTAQLRCTIIYLASSRARRTLVSLFYHAAAQVLDDGGTRMEKERDAEIEKSTLPVIGPGLNGRNSNSSSTDSLLSLLIPTPLRETLWATVALYLGWRLVSRLR